MPSGLLMTPYGGVLLFGRLFVILFDLMVSLAHAAVGYIHVFAFWFGNLG